MSEYKRVFTVMITDPSDNSSAFRNTAWRLVTFETLEDAEKFSAALQESSGSECIVVQNPYWPDYGEEGR